MTSTDKTLLYIIDVLVFLKKIKNPSEFCDEIGMLRQTLTKIKNGTQHFTVEQIATACRKYDINANCIVGLQKNIFNSSESPVITDLNALSLPTMQK